jgi:hypothetical protein
MGKPRGIAGLCGFGELSYRTTEKCFANPGFSSSIWNKEETEALWENSQLYNTTTANIDEGG